ncbi:DM13 domain-containing protein [Streptomyces sp. NBC_01498]|uniref:DM13 domain-containing protein n=1 Tax=Streptomyces sp. NBC_01498 TaxID=2975870 RepID=UPI002E7AD449|nr:DM13 domain-containing protein [Streptomyces sp. NBC_01498]WTL25330.1 DM13 domain-containing protein [Streptomyces sp. NBC_01498]
MCRTRRHRPLLRITTALVAVAVAVGLYLFQPWRLFTTVRVDEKPPTATAQPAASAPGQSPSTAAEQPLTGMFLSHEHETSGSVSVLEPGDGTTTLRLTDLRTSDGPALRVWLSDQPVERDGGGNLDDGEHIDLGSLKGNEGNQNYAIPAGTDLGEFSTVTIWCERFSVSFGAAELDRPA